MTGRRIGLGLLLLLLGLLLAVALVLGTTGGSRWLLARLPGVAVESFEGRLAGEWQAERLIWTDGAQRVELVQPRFAWSPACLLRLTLCLRRVEAERVSLVLPPATEADDTPFDLPALRLPLSIELEEARVGQLVIDDADPLSDLQLSARWVGDGLRIERASVRQGALALELTGHLLPEGDWPLRAEGSLDLPAPDDQPWRLALKVDGELRQRLRLAADSSGYLAGRLTGEVEPLAEHLPASAHVEVDGFKASAELPDTLRLDHVMLNATGNLADGYRVEGGASLPGEGGAVGVTLKGRVDAAGAEIAALRLEAGEGRNAVLAGTLDWRETFAADARLDWHDFPWPRLYPLDEPPAVSAQRLQVQLRYRDGAYQGQVDADLLGPAGEFSLATPVDGDLTQVRLPALQLSAGQGEIKGDLGLRFAEGIAWSADLDVDRLDPAYWLAELPGTLAGRLRSQGEWRDDKLAASADLDLKGRLRGQTAALSLQGDGAAERWRLAALELRLGDNRVQGSGTLDQRLAARLQLAAPRLGQLWPGLRGALDGTLDLGGSLEAPQGQLALDGRALGLEDHELGRLDLAVRLDDAQRGTLELTASGIRLGDTDLGTLTASGGGDRRQQRLSLDLRGEKLQAALGLDGRLSEEKTGWRWNGRLASGELHSGGQDWRLQQPASVERLADGRLTLGAHCWVSGDASFCGETNRLLPEPHLRYRLQAFPLASLAPWLPDDFAWQGQLSADVALDLPAAGPRGDLRVSADGGTFRVREGDRWLDFPYQQLNLVTQFKPQSIDSRLAFSGGPLGTLDMQVRLDPRPADRPLSGDFRLAGLDLAVARPFLPGVEHLAGQLNGAGRFSGGLLAPRIDGNLTLSGGELSGGQLPMDIAQLTLRALIAGEQLQVRGDWRSGEQGRGSVTGQASWTAGDLNGDLQLRGERLPVRVEPYADLEVAPNLVARLADGQLAIAGEVDVPRGAIRIRQLPPSTVTVSEDAEVAGRQAPQRQGLQMAMDIEVSVGRDKLTFEGFGLGAELAGRLRIGDNLDTRGELNLNKGRYRAYGQRLDVRRARLLFTGPIDQPFLDVEAVRRVDEVTAGLRISGNAAQPRTQVFSEPAMSEEQALSYLVLGRPLGGTGEDSNLLAEAALGLGLAGSASVTGDIASRLGISDFQLDTAGSGQKASVVASGRLSERLSLRYGVGVFEPANTIALRYDLTRRLYLEAASGLASSLDLFYKRDF
ncbi:MULTISPECIES: translocation/assembly module TamB [unclassified Pseudomonas]|uniref:translocation/assembly module TamB domain-containing protein n=1 Tax=unclassified Pseudomonas TaxID=196821 RepID=UPI00244C853E|nr:MULTISPECIES: translocation/assembly module TamB [unclassified Pseudomonas]MDG9930929.1 translocation/assembly module TamB [Pseudomonas sp. GD04042]MDH0485352.1 translocation/assembly module TamB [Pseudomonas sp. GD04015]MDH0606094.1 translocation/assembly module TamB [Pseudomonas sp. GD03869]